MKEMKHTKKIAVHRLKKCNSATEFITWGFSTAKNGGVFSKHMLEKFTLELIRLAYNSEGVKICDYKDKAYMDSDILFRIFDEKCTFHGFTIYNDDFEIFVKDLYTENKLGLKMIFRKTSWDKYVGQMIMYADWAKRFLKHNNGVNPVARLIQRINDENIKCWILIGSGNSEHDLFTEKEK